MQKNNRDVNLLQVSNMMLIKICVCARVYYYC